MKKVLITGGQGDIAKAIEELLKNRGGYEVRSPGRRELDVTDIDSIQRYVNGFVPDALINNAGYVAPQSIKDADIDSMRRSLDVNLGGVFCCAAVALRCNPRLEIINIGSSAATKVHATWSSYCAAKSAVVMATRCWAADGLYAVCLSPGRTLTKMRKGLYPDEDPETLMSPRDFAVVVEKALRREYASGSHIAVTKQNVKELMHG